ncbi:MAG: 2-amino-4-hydroxy-6-hydroxymethyldihydropteridine diphosphokinase [Candidatus Thiodiazotropha sp.]
MSRVRAWLSLGSNIDPEQRIPAALESLKAQFGGLVTSPIYESVALGFSGDNFHNLVVGIETELQPRELLEALCRIEIAHGRVRGAEKFSSRTLDIDLLTYGDRVIQEAGIQLPRDEIVRYAFVLLPLSEVAPLERHPLSGRTYGELWSEFDASEQSLWRVEQIQADD